MAAAGSLGPQRDRQDERAWETIWQRKVTDQSRINSPPSLPAAVVTSATCASLNSASDMSCFHPLRISASRTSFSPTFIKLPVQLMFLFFTDSFHYPSSLSFICVSHIPLAGLYCISVGG
ncbi:unnamed protein product [Leuciscus chuanchicus]